MSKIGCYSKLIDHMKNDLQNKDSDINRKLPDWMQVVTKTGEKRKINDTAATRTLYCMSPTECLKYAEKLVQDVSMENHLHKALKNDSNKQSSRGFKYGKDTGRVKVFVRIRPFTQDEKAKGLQLAYGISNHAQVKLYQDDKGLPEKTFTFDHVFPPEQENEEVCKILTEPLMKSATTGFNGTLMAYGQTGSGKTYTLMSESGITKSLVNRCFTHIQHDVNHAYKVNISYLQIYHEKIFDLLNEGKNDLSIREHPKTGVYVENMTEYVARSPEEVFQFIATGKKKLIFAETKMNRTSSRSHAVLQMAIERQLNNDSAAKGKKEKLSLERRNSLNDQSLGLDLDSLGKDVIIRGKIHICDLAGSERIKRTGAVGDRLSEAQHINSSLLELGNVIAALADENVTHVPFRNSILTRMLQESLGGNCKTSLVVCVSPSIKDLHETKCTLSFGQRAMKVKNTAYVNMEVDFKSLSDQLLKKLDSKDEEIQAIRQQCKEQVRIACENLQLEFDQSKDNHAQLMLSQKESYLEKINLLSEEVKALGDDVFLKTSEISKYQDTIFSLEDESRLQNQLVLTAIRIDTLLSKSFVFEKKDDYSVDIKCLSNICQILTKHCNELEQNDALNASKLLSFLEELRVKLTKIEEDNDAEGILLERLLQIKKQLSRQLEAVADLKIYSTEIPVLVYKHFLEGYLKKGIRFAEFVSYHYERASLCGENKNLVVEISRLSQSLKDVEDRMSKEILNSKKDSVNQTKNSSSIGVQVKDVQDQVIVKNSHENPPAVQFVEAAKYDEANVADSTQVGLPKKFLTTTLEKQEKITTEIETEDIIDKDLFADTKAKFSNFGNTLSRIEGLFKLDRQLKLESLTSRFSKSSELSRSRSSIGYKESDSKFRMSKHNYYPTSATSYTESMDKFMNRIKDGSSNIFRHQPSETEMRRIVSLEMDNSSLKNNCKALETEIESIRSESKELLKLLQDLSHVNAFTNPMNEFKQMVRNKCFRIPQSTQTVETEIRRDMGKAPLKSPKVAHIKPLQNRENHTSEPSSTYAQTNFINLSYDMNEDDVVSNVSSVLEIPRATYTNNSRRSAWQKPHDDFSTESFTRGTSYSSYSPSTTYSQNVFSKLRQRNTSPEVKHSRNRPQTWYGLPNSDFLSQRQSSKDLPSLSEEPVPSISEERPIFFNFTNSWMENSRNTNL